jgi:hypothetical protein
LWCVKRRGIIYKGIHKWFLHKPELQRQFNLRLSLSRNDCARVAGSPPQTVLAEMAIELGHDHTGVTPYLFYDISLLE